MTGTITDEWDDYVENVLSEHRDLTPDGLAWLKMIFFAGAASMFVLLPFCESPDALKREIEEQAASVRRPLQ